MTSEDKRPSVGAVVAGWARDLHPDSDEASRRGDSAARARLRRAATPAVALAEPACIDLVARLRGADGSLPAQIDAELDWMRRAGSNGGSSILEGIGTLAAVLASADRPSAPGGTPPPARFAEALGQPAAAEAPLYAPIRFTKLLNAQRGEEQLRALRRAVLRLRGAKRPFLVTRFAMDLLHWSGRTRLEWTFQYHQRAFAIPAANDRDEIA